MEQRRLLLDATTDEKTVKLIQLDKIINTITRHTVPYLTYWFQ